jgi:hypothetical protein
MEPLRTQTSVGMETPDETMARARTMLGEPTVSETYKGFTAPQADNEYNTAMDEMGGMYRQQATQKVDPNQAYRDSLRQYQAQIDATNKIYEQQLRGAQNEGLGRLGSTTAMSARSGTLGSDFGQAQNDKVLGYNREIEGGIQAQQNAKIAEIMGLARKGAADEIAAKTKAKQEGAESYLAYLGSKTERRKSGLSTLAQSLISQGVDPDEIDPAALKQIASQYGVSEDDIKASYFDARKVADAEAAKADLATRKTEADISKSKADIDRINAEIAQGKWQSISEGTMLRNLETGETIKNPKTYAPSSSGGAAGAGGVASPYANDLDAIVGATLSTIPSKFGQETFQAQLNRTRNDADKVSLVAAQVLKGAPAEVKRDFTNQAVGIKEIDKAIAAIDRGVQTGVLQNSLQYTFNVFGKDYDPALAAISQNITAAIQPYRNSVTGAAWGEQEDNEYAALFGSTKYDPAALKQRLQGVKEVLKSKSAEGLNSYVNPLNSYGNVFQTGSLGSDIRTLAEQAGYDYDAMIGDGLSDDQIRQALNGN